MCRCIITINTLNKSGGWHKGTHALRAGCGSAPPLQMPGVEASHPSGLTAHLWEEMLSTSTDNWGGQDLIPSTLRSREETLSTSAAQCGAITAISKLYKWGDAVYTSAADHCCGQILRTGTLPLRQVRRHCLPLLQTTGYGQILITGTLPLQQIKCLPT